MGVPSCQAPKPMPPMKSQHQTSIIMLLRRQQRRCSWTDLSSNLSSLVGGLGQIIHLLCALISLPSQRRYEPPCQAQPPCSYNGAIPPGPEGLFQKRARGSFPLHDCTWSKGPRAAVGRLARSAEGWPGRAEQERSRHVQRSQVSAHRARAMLVLSAPTYAPRNPPTELRCHSCVHTTPPPTACRWMCTRAGAGVGGRLPSIWSTLHFPILRKTEVIQDLPGP